MRTLQDLTFYALVGAGLLGSLAGFYIGIVRPCAILSSALAGAF